MKQKSAQAILLCIALLLTSCGSPSPQTTPTALPESTATAAIPPTTTSTPIPLVTVNQPAECRGGPGEKYESIGTFQAGQQVEVIGRNEDQSYWVVRSADGRKCWLDAQSATLSLGEIGLLPKVTPPPVPTPAPPAAPSELTVTPECEPAYKKAGDRSVQNQVVVGVIVRFTISWKDNADDETGYQIFKNGEYFALVEPDVTRYVYTVSFPGHNINYAVIFGVVAYNEVGLSKKIEVTANQSCYFK